MYTYVRVPPFTTSQVEPGRKNEDSTRCNIGNVEGLHIGVATIPREDTQERPYISLEDKHTVTVKTRCPVCSSPLSLFRTLGFHPGEHACIRYSEDGRVNFRYVPTY